MLGKQKMSKQIDVKESTTYESLIGVKVDLPQPPTLNRFFGEDDESDDDGVDTNNAEWTNHWKGMPEYENENNPPYKKLIISFRTKEDYDEFAKIIDQNLTEKTKSIWHPALDREANSLMRWVEDDQS